MLSHFNIVNNAANIAECMKLTSSDRLCIPVPFFHCFGCVLGVLACVSAGAAMIPIEQFSPPAVLKTVEQEACTALHGVPTMFIALLNDSRFSEYDLSHVRTGIMAGSPCPAEVMREVIGKMRMTGITIAYGQTEASPVITQTRTDDSFERRVETAGRALPHIEVRIVRPGTSQEADRGEQGELCTRGYHVMKGYYKNQEATEEAIDKDGWLHTGDLAVMDEDGYCKITGRLKDMLIRAAKISIRAKLRKCYIGIPQWQTFRSSACLIRNTEKRPRRGSGSKTDKPLPQKTSEPFAKNISPAIKSPGMFCLQMNIQ